jgi:Pyruvate/2-oxoacid:ferredoxin oxidoreductase gamma subunit
MNVAMLAQLTRYVPVAPAYFEEAIRKNLKPNVHELSIRTYRQSLESVAEKCVPKGTRYPAMVHAEGS